ncbi:hypothetical protein C8R46DRAFT_1300070 [Mycena filopes]|nr:hypothetical protein C8R46DRAFT_1300070 [Mycena filopes]
MFLNCFFFILLFQLHQTFALVFAPIVGPFVTGAQVPVSWTLDGTEPANGFQLWFSATGVSQKLADIPPFTTSIVVLFPGNGDGVFQAISGTFLLATSNEVDLATTVLASPTSTFSASVISGPSSSSVGNVAASASSPSGPTSSPAAESNATTKGSAITTEALLGIIVGTLAVIAVIVVASISLFIHRRRRAAATGTGSGGAYPFEANDVEKQLAQQITPFDPQARLVPLRGRGPSVRTQTPAPPPPRGSSLVPLPNLSSTTLPSTTTSRRQAYLNAQLQRLDTGAQDGPAGALPDAEEEGGSIVFGPLSSVPSDVTPVAPLPSDPPFVFASDPAAGRNGKSLPLPPISEDPYAYAGPSSRRGAYLTNQLTRLAQTTAERRPSDGDGSVYMSPLSSVPSESTAPRRPSDASTSMETVRPYPYAQSVSTVSGPQSPIQFLRPTQQPGSLTSPVGPTTRVAPWQR